ncbi:hypothetical protein FJ434_01305 [Mesorhizobium sp. B2-5-13]|uniref:hypothetical protein n=1 Tax=unclassified Mesorhizobium TaxID=325217 RepID=UPI0011274D73|nr:MULTISPECIES: hypothetical protein [unclassified Mesorhizobium]TPJ43455.1 hypothetical protein FJ432_05885 [Mesorhizobium sp. B2-6-5]TPJ93364.1 hypothetical protein FJ434_01305 [Mesorhizobium sp. B2-5-13]TPK47551.1 hypothetical protein FJ560_16980 [Mesorhizobium sp. B2-5-5]
MGPGETTILEHASSGLTKEPLASADEEDDVVVKQVATTRGQLPGTDRTWTNAGNRLVTQAYSKASGFSEDAPAGANDMVR